jgi:hypothetical protein
MIEPTQFQKVAASIFGWLACLFGVLSCIATLWCGHLYDTAGKNNYTVGITVPTVIFSLGASLVGIPLGIYAYHFGRKVLGWVGVVLCVTEFAIIFGGGVSR